MATIAPHKFRDYVDNRRQGVLTVTIPVAERAKPRKINVELNGSEQRSIDAGAEPVGSSSN
ncbi:MAG TPA: hypothetical protein VF065_12390 [Ilumatobacter sp.]